MFLAFSDRAALPAWAVVLGLVALSPLPLALPSGIALAAIGLIGSALLFRRLGRFPYSPAAAPHSPLPATAHALRTKEVAAVDRTGFRALTLATAVITLERGPASGSVGQMRHDVKDPRPRADVGLPASVINVSRPAQPWRWTSALLAPIELLGAAWSVPLAILLIAVPIALTVALALWFGRMVLGRF